MYKLALNGVTRLADGAMIPPAEGNADWEVYQAWLLEGNAPHKDDSPATSSVPRAVTMRQARLALLAAGLLSTVNTAVANMPGAAGEAARIEWEYSGVVERDKALVQALAPVLGLNDAQLDALFIAAAAL